MWSPIEILRRLRFVLTVFVDSVVLTAIHEFMTTYLDRTRIGRLKENLFSANSKSKTLDITVEL